MLRNKNNSVHAIFLALILQTLLVQHCWAEYPALEEALKTSIEKAAAGIRGTRTLVYVYDLTGADMPWRVRGAVQTEILAGLRARNVDAVEVEREPAFKWLTTSAKPGLAADVAKWKKTPSEFNALVIGQLHRQKDRLELQFSVHQRSNAKAVIVPRVPLNEKVLALPANTPQLNLQVVEFVRERFGQMIGNGECSTAADEALKAAHAKQIGLYHWGRQLGEYEAWLPGDIIQFSAVKFADKDKKVYMGFSGHTAIIDEVSGPQVVRILHQNFGAGGKTISRASLNFADLLSGTIVIYRPTTGDSPLPATLLPRRKTPAKVIKNADKQIDLLKTIDPELDVVHGLWHTWDGWLRCHNEAFNRMQIPVDVPNSYTINSTVKRIGGKYFLGFGLVVGGRQVMLVLDSHPGDSVGLHLLDGKQVHEQPNVQHKVLLPLDATVKLKVRVTPGTVELSVDEKPTFQWKGDPKQLSLQPEWELPRKDWLFLASHYSDFQITTLTMSFP